jgi:hypothetical protein
MRLPSPTLAAGPPQIIYKTVVNNYSKMIKRTVFTLILSILSLGVVAQKKLLTNVVETKELSKKVVDLFSQNKVSEAFAELTPYWPMPQNELDNLEEKTIQYLNILDGRFGGKIDGLKIREEKISDIAIRETFILRYSFSALRLIFTYYKNADGWIVNAFKWDDSFTEEFRE